MRLDRPLLDTTAKSKATRRQSGTPSHPQTRRAVKWVDIDGAFQHEGITWPEWLEAITEEDCQRSARALRRSGRRGFEAYGRNGTRRPG
ncbi:hypothetical protein MO973_05800 [Paenibacillus sp. TRM 82003]|nr:hypothetical protein [Paenibacillus sp. TRM 82003]